MVSLSQSSGGHLLQLTIEQFKLIGERGQQEFISTNFPTNSRSAGHRKLVVGVGHNDSKYAVAPLIDGGRARCPAYKNWFSMLDRCYSGKQSTYDDVNVSVEWKDFSAFLLWWKDNKKDGYHLDKDLLTDSRIYSAETCVFVPPWLNAFTLDSNSTRGEFLIGASYNKHRSKYISYCSNPMTKRMEYLGYFNTQYEAHICWKKKKLEHTRALRSKMDEIDIRIYPRVVEIIERAR